MKREVGLFLDPESSPPILPPELWRMVAAHLVSLSLRSNDFESLLNYLAAYRGATPFARPALCFLLLRFDFDSVRDASAFSEDERKLLQPTAMDRDPWLEEQERRALEGLRVGIRDYGTVYAQFMLLASDAPLLRDEGLRELVYTLHIVQLRERLLFRRTQQGKLIELCSACPSSKTLLCDVFYEIWPAESLVKRFYELDVTVHDGKLAILESDEAESEAEDSFDHSSELDEDVVENENERMDLEEAEEKRRIDEDDLAAFNRTRSPLLPLNLLPGVGVTRLGRCGGQKRAKKAIQRLRDPLRRIMYRHVLNELLESDYLSRDIAMSTRALCYAVLAEARDPAARLSVPRRNSLLQDVVLHGTHLFMPDNDAYHSFRMRSLFTYFDMDGNVSIREKSQFKVRALDFYRSCANRDSKIYHRLFDLRSQGGFVRSNTNSKSTAKSL